MSDLISRETLVDKTEILYQHTEAGEIIPWSAVRVCEINNIPTIDAEPVRHGRWVMTLYTTTSTRGRVISNKKFECSECGYHNGRKRNKYCPNCGVKMDGGQHEKR